MNRIRRLVGDVATGAVAAFFLVGGVIMLVGLVTIVLGAVVLVLANVLFGYDPIDYNQFK